MPAKKDTPPPPPKREAPQPKVEEGAPTWMVTFADMMTLLLCFFVLLLSFANQDVVKFRELMGSIKDAFGVQVERPSDRFTAFSPSKVEREEIKLTQEKRQLLGLIMLIRRIVEPDPDLKQKVSVLPEKEGVLMRVSSGVMFRPGSAELTPGSKAVLDTVIELLNEQKYDVVVRGHSDNVMPEGTRFGSNWELSAARAAAAVDYIHSRSDIKSTRLKAVGYGSSRPLLPNTSEENRAKNRRLEFYYHRPDADGM